MRVYNHENRLSVDKCAYLNRELQNKSIHDHTFENYYFTKEEFFCRLCYFSFPLYFLVSGGIFFVFTTFRKSLRKGSFYYFDENSLF